MGSYRWCVCFPEGKAHWSRGAPTCGDIDSVLTRPTGDGRNHGGPSHSVLSKPRAKAIAGILQHLLPRLGEEGIPTGDLGTPEDDCSLEAKYMGICRRSPEDKMRRIGTSMDIHP